MKKKILAAVALVALFLSGCSTVMQYTDDVVLYGNIWKLEKLNGAPVTKPATGSDVTFGIVAGLNNIAGSGSCNQYFGSAKVSGSKISFSDIGSTKMACDDMNLEISYFQKLREVDSFGVSTGKLIFYSGGKAILEFSVLQKK